MPYFWIMPDSIKQHEILRLDGGDVRRVHDAIAVEEPVEIRLVHGQERKKNNLAVTMRTPGNDEELATGFLLTEGIINSISDIEGFEQVDENVVQLSLSSTVVIQTKKLERNFYTTSSCGVCGKASIDAIKTECSLYDKAKPFVVESEVIKSLSEKLRQQQSAFDATGGIHAAALFDIKGNIISVREDVGRHNAMDKLVGASMKEGLLPLQEHIVLLSGRASFELIQKATMAGVKMVCAVGAPSSLAVETADEFGITLVGFLKNDKFNIYTGKERVTS